jgi:hypothetical protein
LPAALRLLERVVQCNLGLGLGSERATAAPTPLARHRIRRDL